MGLGDLDEIERNAREASTLIRYLGEGDYVTRRYVSQGAEINTGDYADYPMVVRDGMPIRDHFTLDSEQAAEWDRINRRPARELAGLRRLAERPSPFAE